MKTFEDYCYQKQAEYFLNEGTNLDIFVEGWWDSIKGGVGNAMKGVGNIATSMPSAVGSYASQMAKGAGNILGGSLVQTPAGLLRMAGGDVKGGANQALGGVARAAYGVPQYWSAMASPFLKFGQNVYQGATGGKKDWTGMGMQNVPQKGGVMGALGQMTGMAQYDPSQTNNPWLKKALSYLPGGGNNQGFLGFGQPTEAYEAVDPQTRAILEDLAKKQINDAKRMDQLRLEYRENPSSELRGQIADLLYEMWEDNPLLCYAMYYNG